MPLRPGARFRLYIAAVAVVGVCTAMLLVPNGVAAISGGPPLVLWFAAAVVVASVAAGLIYGHAGPAEDSGRDGFVVPVAFALLLLAGTNVAVTALVVGAALGQLWRRPLWHSWNALGAAVLSLVAGGGVVHLVADQTAVLSHPTTSVVTLAAIAAGGATVFLLDIALSGTGVALAQHIRVPHALAREFGSYASTTGVLLTLTPAVVVVASTHPAIAPLLVLPVAAAYRNARALLAKELLALHDPLTGLPNRRLFLERLAVSLSDAADAGTKVAVLLIDLDRFKEVNDRLGHHVGDLLLQAVGPALEDGVADNVTVARLGGDEFALCVPDVDGADEAVRVAKGILHRLSAPFQIDAYTIDIGASIGIALYPGDAEDVSTAMQRADIAMYVAKETRGGYEVYSAEHDPHRRQRITSPRELREATELGQLVVHYQPKAHLRTGLAHGVEALVRWQHPTLGLVAPGEFIPLAERTGLMGAVTTFVLARSLEQCRVWADAGFELRLAVNLSVQSLYDDTFPRLLAGLLRRSRVPAERLILDVTESTIMADPRRATRVLGDLAGMGVTLAIDDFGTGYSSLSYLKQLPVSELKVDKSFVLGMATDSDDAVIVHSTIDLGQKFGLEVVAEGVESARVWRLLADLGCDLAQGSFVCPPLPAPDVLPWLQSNAAQVRSRQPTVRAGTTQD